MTTEADIPARRQENDVDLVTFLIGRQRCGVPVGVTERIVRVVEITPLPGASLAVAGVIDVQGHVVPVFDMRARLGVVARDLRLSDQLLVARTRTRTVALLIDEVTDVLRCRGEDIVPIRGLVPGLELVSGIAKLEDGLIVIQDLDRFLSSEEEQVLERSLAAGKGDVHE